MGTTTYGSLDVTFSRELTETEYAVWERKLKEGRPGNGICGNPKHDRAPLTDARLARCRHFSGSPDGYCFPESIGTFGGDRYDPDGWTFDNSTWGDVGSAQLARNGFGVETSGKVYDLTDAVAFFVEALPADVTAEGSGAFDSDGSHWGLLVEGRETREVSAGVVVEGDPAPQGSVVWLIGHVNFADGSVSVAPYCDEHQARQAYGKELTEHAEIRQSVPGAYPSETNISERPPADAPWVAHFVADGECLTWLDREVIR